MEERQIKNMLVEAEQISLESQKTMHRILERSEMTKKVAVDTMDRLNEQGSQINRIQRSLDHIDVNISQGNREIKSIDSVLPRATPTIKSGEHRNEERTNFKVIGNAKERKGEAIGDMLDSLANNIDDLKRISIAMGLEIDTQNKQLDEINTSIVKTEKGLIKANQKVRNLI